MAEKPLEGQVALVTGGARRIGRSIALALAGAGARVAVHYNTSKGDAEATRREIEQRGGEAFLTQGDLSRVDEARRVAEAALQHFGRVDLLINNAGIWEPHHWDKITEAVWDRFLDTNLKSQFFLAQALAPQMKQRGRGCIVNLASIGGLRAWSEFIPYCVSKAGVIMLTRALAKALGPEIRVNAVAPGSVQFPGEAPDQNYIRRAPLQRTGTPDDIVQTVLFLCTSADFVTGQTIVVDGGFSLT
ncbi:MAG TPA: glucose 1-dehydrogenase [Candidatus Xenobia bacterium]|nr:glucose 1-dehydrogenase [Candidatus Xenobia bacterium]